MNYRFGFNGMEKDDEVAGDGNSYTAQFWQYDPRLGRRWNIDPVVKPSKSPYLCFSGSPIWRIDPNGDDDWEIHNGVLKLSSRTKDSFHRIYEVDEKGEKTLIYRTDHARVAAGLSIWQHHTGWIKFGNAVAQSKNERAWVDMQQRATYEGFYKDLERAARTAQRYSNDQFFGKYSKDTRYGDALKVGYDVAKEIVKNYSEDGEFLPKSGFYYDIIVGSFSSEEGAENFISENSLSATIDFYSDEGLYRVNYGTYEDPEKALEALEVARETVDTESWWLVRENNEIE